MEIEKSFSPLNTLESVSSPKVTGTVLPLCRRPQNIHNVQDAPSEAGDMESTSRETALTAAGYKKDLYLVYQEEAEQMGIPDPCISWLIHQSNGIPVLKDK